MASSSTVKMSYSCRILLASNVADTISTGWTQRLPLPHKVTVSKVCSEKFLKTKPTKPVTEVRQHMIVDLGIRLASDDWLKWNYRTVEFYFPFTLNQDRLDHFHSGCSIRGCKRPQQPRVFQPFLLHLQIPFNKRCGDSQSPKPMQIMGWQVAFSHFVTEQVAAM